MTGIETTRGVGEERDRGRGSRGIRVGIRDADGAHRRELRVHCYRMLGNIEDAEDLVQETFVKAWRSRAGFEDRSTFRAWLYRIATNACLDAIQRSRRRVRVVRPDDLADRPPAFDDVPWLQPIPDSMLEVSAPNEDEPDAVVVAKETIELAFLAAIQHRKPPNDEERELLQRYMEAHARADATAVVELFGDDVRFSMPPEAAACGGLLAVHLCRVFREVTDITISQYQTRLRVNEVLERLTAGEDDLSSLAAAVGFADHRHMTRTVSAVLGAAPSSLREQLRTDR